MRLRALQHRFGTYTFSRHRLRPLLVELPVLVKLRDEYIEYDPFWWDQCWVCGLEDILRQDDPVIYRELAKADRRRSTSRSAASS